MTRSILFALIAAVAVAGQVEAGYTVSVTPGTTYSTGFVGDFEPTGADMDGLKVTATFLGGATETVFWADTLNPLDAAGIAAGTGWSLTLNGDTFGNAWTLSNDSSLTMTHLRIEGGNFGKTVFDLKEAGHTSAEFVFGGQGTGTNTGTPGSELGWTFQFINFAAFEPPLTHTLDIDAQYSNLVGLSPASPLGDLFAVLDLDFTGSDNGLLPQFVVHFYADTDIIDELTPPNDSTPEPSSLAIFGGLALAGGWSRWRRRKP